MSTIPQTWPPLESGDRLTREEFHRRYCARPDIRKAELIDGVVYVPPFAVSEAHSDPHGDFVGWLYTYKTRTPGVELRIEGTIFMPGENEVQPDALLFRVPPPPGGARRNSANYLEGVPQLIGEIAASSATYDLHDKLRMYERVGVHEYIVWRVYDQRIDWFRLQDGRYVRIEPDARGVIESEAFPGLRLNVPKMLAGDDAGVLAELDPPTE
jgi:Uma2 family endonuclease